MWLADSPTVGNPAYDPFTMVTARSRCWLFVAVLTLLHPAVAPAVPGASPAPPLPTLAEDMQEWIEWAAHGTARDRCPSVVGGPDQRLCAWPTRLAVTLEPPGATFRLDWLAEDDGWVSLPGGADLWPTTVALDGEAAVITGDAGTPRLWVTPGAHVVTGAFQWTTPPAAIPLPPATAIVTLTRPGEAPRLARRDPSDSLWLDRPADDSAAAADQLDVSVDRQVIDEIPLELETRVTLRVAGRDREALLGPVLPPQFIPVSLTGPLPMRLEPDGQLRVRLSPGIWTVALVARHEGPTSAITAPTPAGAWDPEEVWVFAARERLRVVTVEGLPQIDPQQTDLPEEWKTLPAYLVVPEATMRLVEQRRGDSHPAADALRLDRSWWLDFDGAGFTIRDRLSGTLQRSWRLDMSPPAQLGRVAIDDQDQLITTRPGPNGSSGPAPAGIEVRQGTVHIEADSRLHGAPRSVPAVGWDTDVDALAGTLNLPPGWRLLFARGVDEAKPTWVTTWTLLDLFVVLIAAQAVARLWGWPAGMLALAALALSYPESGAPRALWLVVIALEALRRVLPDGRLHRVTAVARVLALAALVVTLLPFVGQQLQQALFPALERQPPSVGLALSAPPPAPPPPEPEGAGIAMLRALKERDMESPAEPAARLERAPVYRYEVDPQAVVQTGPGVPVWQWQTVTLRWSGPVTRDQQVRLVLLPPGANAVVTVVRVALAVALTLVLLGAWPRRRTAVAAVAALTALLVGPGAARADFPPPELLNQLRTWMLARPPCEPSCASIASLHVTIGASTLDAVLDVDAAADTAIPLPGAAAEWTPEAVTLDDAPAVGVLRDEAQRLLLRVPVGRHVVRLQGPLPDRGTVRIPLPLKPHRVEVTATGWTVDGVQPSGAPDDALILRRIAGDAADTAGLEPGALPPFVAVERHLHLGLTWSVETTVRRASPQGAPIVLDVPLLEGELVTTAGVRVVDGLAQVALAPGQDTASWQSVLPEAAQVLLRAPETSAFTEVWRLDASPLWHVTATGIPPVVPGLPVPAIREREWRPWPGESVTLAVVRPAAVPGEALTIDAVRLAVWPGRRATEGKLEVRLRSSRGGQHTLQLPPDAVVEAVEIDDRPLPLEPGKTALTVPIVPGAQHIAVEWRQPTGISTRYVTPLVDLGAPSVNTDLAVDLSPDRWTLFVTGPRLGPAVLFWGVLAVVALAAMLLGAATDTPLRRRHWFLLGVGLTQVPPWAAVLVVAWLLALAWRRRRGADVPGRGFHALQVLLALASVTAVAVLFAAVEQGLLGSPEMQVGGNGSSALLLRWYQDRSGPTLPQASVVSLPILAYRGAMLAWALWLAYALLGWLRWGWECFTAGGGWRPWPPLRRRGQPAPVRVSPGPAAPPSAPGA